MSILIGKANHFILNRRTISGADSLDDAAVEGRPIETAPDDFMGGRIRISDVTGDLIRFDLLG
jgi:hypothetical protein